MSIGIGLGGFVDGFERGYGLRQRMEQDQLQRQEVERAQTQRDALDQINVEAREQFDAGVQSGEFSPDQFTEFWVEHAVPRMVQEKILAGDRDGANALREWAQTEDAKRGSQLFASSLLKSLHGDPMGALHDAIEAGKLEGYIAHGYEILGGERLDDVAGRGPGLSVSYRDGDGNEMVQDIADVDLPSAISNLLNPPQAFESRQAAKAAEAERTADREDFRKREEIKRDVAGAGGQDEAKRREDAIKTLRSQSEPDALNPDRVPFDELSRDEQERLIQQEMDLQTGQRTPVAPSERVMVDSQTGQPAPPAAPPASPSVAVPNPQSAPGLGGPPPEQAQPRPAPISSRPGEPVQPSNSPMANEMPGLGSQPRPGGGDRGVQDLERRVSGLLENGQDPAAIARDLSDAGVPRNKWPTQLQRAINPGH